MTVDNTLKLVDETLRDGGQSLWGMLTSYHMSEPVLGEIAKAGFTTIDGPWHLAYPLMHARFFGEDPKTVYRMFSEKVRDSDSNIMLAGICMGLHPSRPAENKTIVRLCYKVAKDWIPEINQIMGICCTRDEIKNEFPYIFPLFRSWGIETIPYFAIGHGPRNTDEWYGAQVKEVVEKFKPISLCIKDVDGLLTPERIRTLIPAMQKYADGTPLELHLHGMNGLNTYNATVAMQLGLRKITTCIPPMANSSSHPSVFDIVRNAQEMGISHNIDLERCKIVQERLTKIGKAYGHPVDNSPLTYDLSYYKHMVPGGVISTLTTQLAQLGLEDQLPNVLEEIPLILEDLGNPIMITPHSQNIVTQAVLNVQLGRWEQCIDSMIEFAAGHFGVDDAGVNDMDQNLKDKLLSLPQAKKIREKGDGSLVEYINSEPSPEEVKVKIGLPPNASDEEFFIRYLLEGEAMKNVIPGGPDAYRKYL